MPPARFPAADQRRTGFALVLAAGLCLSTAPTAIKLGLTEGADPVRLLAFRLLLGWLLVAAAILLFQPRLLRIDRRGLVHCLLVGTINTVSLLCFYEALARVDASVATFTFSIYPATTLLLLAAAGERFSAVSLGRLLLAAAGIYLLVGPGGTVSAGGLALLAVTVWLYSLHIVWIQWFLGSYRSLTITCWILAGMAASSGLIALGTASAEPLGATGWAVVVWTAVFATAVARLAMFSGIRRIGSGQTALLGPFEILLSVGWAVWILGERRSAVEWLGGGLILTSAALATVDRPSAAGDDKHAPGVEPADAAPR